MVNKGKEKYLAFVPGFGYRAFKTLEFEERQRAYYKNEPLSVTYFFANEVTYLDLAPIGTHNKANYNKNKRKNGIWNIQPHPSTWRTEMETRGQKSIKNLNCEMW